MAVKLIRASGGITPPAPSAPPRPVHVQDHNTAMIRADMLVHDTEQNAQELRQRAEEDCRRMVAEARQQGAEEGRQSAAELMTTASTLQQQLCTGMEREALEAAFEATKALLEEELKHNPRLIVDVVKKALNNCRHQREIFVRINPKDGVALRESKRSLLDVLSRARDVDIREDPAVGQGGCIIETEIGMVDANIDSQLANLRRHLLKRES